MLKFSINIGTRTCTFSPAELNLGRPLRGPLNGLLQPNIMPDSLVYENVKITEFKDLMKENLHKARLRQKRNYNKKR